MCLPLCEWLRIYCHVNPCFPCPLSLSLTCRLGSQEGGQLVQSETALMLPEAAAPDILPAFCQGWRTRPEIHSSTAPGTRVSANGIAECLQAFHSSPPKAPQNGPCKWRLSMAQAGVFLPSLSRHRNKDTRCQVKTRVSPTITSR